MPIVKDLLEVLTY